MDVERWFKYSVVGLSVTLICAVISIGLINMARIEDEAKVKESPKFESLSKLKHELERKPYLGGNASTSHKGNSSTQTPIIPGGNQPKSHQYSQLVSLMKVPQFLLMFHFQKKSPQTIGMFIDS